MPLCHNCRNEAAIIPPQPYYYHPTMDPGDTCDRCGYTRPEDDSPENAPDPAGSTGDHTRDPLFAVVDLLVWLIVIAALIWTLVIITL